MIEKIKKAIQWVVIPFVLLGAAIFALVTRVNTLIEKGKRVEDDEEYAKVKETSEDSLQRADTAYHDWHQYLRDVRGKGDSGNRGSEGGDQGSAGEG